MQGHRTCQETRISELIGWTTGQLGLDNRKGGKVAVRSTRVGSQGKPLDVGISMPVQLHGLEWSWVEWSEV
jgi:hypothetical protein